MREDVEERRRTEGLRRRPRDWGDLARVVAWLLAAGFVVGTVVFLLVQFEVTVPPYTPPESRDLVDRLLADFSQFQRDVWPQELVWRLAFTVGFAALAAMGPILRRFFGRQDMRSGIIAATLGLAGTLGVVAELLVIGVMSYVIQPQYCQCKYAAEQVIGRNEVLNAAFGAEQWIFYGLFFLAAVAFLLVGRLTLATGRSRVWGYLAYLGAGLFLIGLIANLFEQERVFDLAVAIGGGVVMPVWALWFARLTRREGAWALAS